MDRIFRPARPADHGDVDRVVRAAFTPYARKLGREVGPDFNARLGASIERGDVYVAAAAGRIAGAALTERREDSLYIDRLAVDPAQQGTGTGSWLLMKLEEVARFNGLPAMSLETAEMMEHLIRLYRRNGFEIVGRGPPGHGKDAHMRVRMAKQLDAAF